MLDTHTHTHTHTEREIEGERERTLLSNIIRFDWYNLIHLHESKIFVLEVNALKKR